MTTHTHPLTVDGIEKNGTWTSTSTSILWGDVELFLKKKGKTKKTPKFQKLRPQIMPLRSDP
jgi:hypothetical protein